MPIFGIIVAMSDALLANGTGFGVWPIVRRAPYVVLWVFCNLLVFNVPNQRHPAAIEEDLGNKPWRPIPSGRVTTKQAHFLALVLYPVVFILSFWLGAGSASLAIILGGTYYSDFKGSDSSPLLRNALNAGGYVAYWMGAASVALTGHRPKAFRLVDPRSRPWAITIRDLLESMKNEHFNSKGHIWFTLLFFVILSTIHIQDMADQKGDSQRQRRSVPLVYGDATARMSLMVVVAFWSLLLPLFWSLPWTAYITPVATGYLFGARLWTMRSENHDTTTFKVWNVWLISIYLLPLIRSTPIW